jgi:hypothetical protein
MSQTGPDTNTSDNLASDLIWGAAAIAAEIGLTPSAVYAKLERGHLPGRKCGDVWVSSRRALRRALAVDVES